MTTVNFDELELVGDLLASFAAAVDLLISLEGQSLNMINEAELAAGSARSFRAAARWINYMAGPAEEIPVQTALAMAHAGAAVFDLRTYINNAFQNELATPVVAQVPVDPDSGVLRKWNFTISGQAGEVVVGGVDEDIQIEQLADGQYEVMMTKGGSLGIGGKFGVADASISGEGSISQTWYTGSFSDAQRLAMQLGLTTGPAGTIINGLVGFRPAQIPPPSSQTDEGAAQAAVDVSTPGASLTSSFGNAGVGAGAGATATAALANTNGRVDAVYSLGGDAQGVFESGGVSAAGSVSADLNASVTLNGADAGDIRVDGSFVASGSVDIAGTHFNPAAGDNAVRVEFSADINAAEVKPDVRAALNDLNSSDPVAAGDAVRSLLKDGITVNYSTFSGQLDAVQFNAGVASGSMSYGSWNQIPGGSGQLQL